MRSAGEEVGAIDSPCVMAREAVVGASIDEFLVQIGQGSLVEIIEVWFVEVIEVPAIQLFGDGPHRQPREVGSAERGIRKNSDSRLIDTYLD